VISFNKLNVLGVSISAISIEKAVLQIEKWIESNKKTYVCVTGVHGVIESQKDSYLKKIHNNAGMCLPDGLPLVWIGKYYKQKDISQVRGADFMLAVLNSSAKKGYSHFFYGGKKGVPETLRDAMKKRFPGLKVFGTYSPPFRPLNEIEENKLIKDIDRIGPDIFWVGLSTPKQEQWMVEYLNRLNTKVMIGVGAAFDFHAGLVKEAPKVIQKVGLEWFFRMCSEPKRLLKRYGYIVPAFLILIFCQIAGLKRYDNQ